MPMARFTLPLIVFASCAPHVPGQQMAWKKHGEIADHYFGSSIANLGDVDSDGIDDHIIGAPQTELGEMR